MGLSDWDITSGEYGVDVIEDTTAFRVGTRSFKLTGANAVVLRSSKSFPIIPGRPYVLGSMCMADSIAAGRTIDMTVDWQNSAKTSVGYGIISSLLTAINEWQWVGTNLTAPTTARWCQIWFGKPAFNFNAWFQSVDLVPDVVGFSAYKSAAQNVVGGAGPTKITFTGTNAKQQPGGGGATSLDMYATGTSTATVRQAGWHRFYSHLMVDIPAAAGAAYVELYKNGALWVTGDYWAQVPVAGYYPFNVEHTEPVLPNDTIEVYFTWAGAGNAAVHYFATGGQSRFTGHRLVF
jgi:hypothetical protein